MSRRALARLAPWVVAMAVLAGVTWLLPRLFPVPESVYQHDPSTTIADSNGVLLREVVNSKGVRSRPVHLDAIATSLQTSVLAAEDEGFFFHGGIDAAALLRALWSNFSEGRTVSGASTISMQLARLVFHHGRDFNGKLEQAWDAMRLEASLTKPRILEAYLNLAPFGPALEGVEAASQWYFQKPASALDWAEASLLAGMIQAPSALDPYINPDGARERRSWVLGRLKTLGRISPEVYETAITAPLPVRHTAPVQAGHFTDYVLANHPGSGPITTTLDLRLQLGIEAIVANHVKAHRKEGITNAAVVVLNNHTGGILSLVGSKEWNESESGFVNGALASRQPGSTLKPFLYALAFTKGWTPASVLADVETEYISNERTLYVPRNYSRTFRGPVLAKEALATSLNIPAIRLLQSLGVEPFLQTLRALGFQKLTKDPDHYGLGLILGNGEVNLLELAGAYATLARGGVAVKPTPFPGTEPGQAVFDPVATFLTTAILSDETLRVQAFGVDNPLMVGFPMAIKTGTSSDWKDSWTVGYTADFTVATWSGDFEATPMNQVSGSTGAGPLFRAVAQLVQEDWGNSPLPPAPNGVKKIFVCAESGQSPNMFCPRKLVAVVADEAPRHLCTMHCLVSIDTRTGQPSSEETPLIYRGQRVAYQLPPEYASWLKDSGKFPVPSPTTDRERKGVILAVDRPRSGDVYIIEPGYDRATQTVELAALSRFPLRRVEWWVDGSLFGTAEWPYSLRWPLEPGHHRVRLKADGVSSREVLFEVR